MTVIIENADAIRYDKDPEGNEKGLFHGEKYRGILKNFNGRDEERIMRNEWD